MPNFEQNARQASSANSGTAYSKLLAICKSESDTQDMSIAGRSGKISISLKDSVSFYDSISHAEDDFYTRMAGADLSNLFFPYRTKRNMLGSGTFPGFHPNALTVKG